MFLMSWTAIFLAAAVVWIPAARWLALVLLVVGYGAAMADRQVGFSALIPIALLLVAAYAVSPGRQRYVSIVGHVLFVVLALALGFHLLPGFHNPRVIGPERFTADALPFKMDLNLDESLVGFWLLLVLPWIRSPRTWRLSLIAGAGGLLLTTVACLSLAVLLGVVIWEPKWPAASGLWLVNNLLLVAFTEEALFRGYLQGGLSRLMQRWRYGDAFAIGIAAVLFGLAHAAGGWQWIVMGSVAGAGYGLAYRFGGLRASVLAHVGLNATHFFLFTYPMLQPPGSS